MVTYIYKVRDKSGQMLRGEMEASDMADLRKKLDEKGYFIIEYSKKGSGGTDILSRLFPVFKKVSSADISVFTWQLYTMVDAGLTLVNSLKIIIRQTKNERLREVIAKVCSRVEEGMSFSSALKEHPQFFSRLYVQMVNAGEVGGVLDEMLRRLAVFLEGQAEIRGRIRSALIYPVLLLAISLCVAVFLIIYVLPKFAVVFQDMGGAMPLPTQILLIISGIIQHYGYLGLFALTGLLIACNRYARTEKGRFEFDQLKLKLPIIGDLTSKATISRFTQTLSILLNGGIPILVSLDVVTEVVGNKVVAKALREVIASVKEGRPIAQPLEENKIFPDMVVNMIRVGEETGALDKMLNKIADFYNKEVDEAIKTFTKIIEPLLVVFMTFVIGFIAVSIFLPMADIMGRIQH